MERRILLLGLRACLSAAVVVGISLEETALAHVNQTTAALTLLLAVLGIATCWGLVESLAASVAGILCFNVLFLPPVGKLTIAATENWVAFVTFVVTAVVASQLSASAKRRAREARPAAASLGAAWAWRSRRGSS